MHALFHRWLKGALEKAVSISDSIAILALVLVTCCSFIPAAELKRPDGSGIIRGKTATSEIVITTTPRLAGAIHSLTWNGQEFIDSFDHGRQLQSAANFDCGQRFIAETFNPTEAGSRADGTGEQSSSKLLHYQAEGSELESTTQMAFWLKPGEKSQGHPARNRKILSDHLITKRVRIGTPTSPQVIDYEVTFTVPRGEEHRYAQFEALTGYMPPVFEQFWRYLPDSKELNPLDDGPGEQASPIVFSTTNGSHAMGIFSPDQPSPGFEGAGYGRFRFKSERVNKWNCVFRYCDADGIAPGKYRFRMYVAVGTREEVGRILGRLIEESRK